MQDFAGKEVVVVGAGQTGLALCRYFCRRGARVILSDRRPAAEIGELPLPAGCAVDLDCGGHDAELFRRAALVAISPGIPLTVPAVAAAVAAGVPVRGEIEIAFAELQAPLVAVTGTNGKSTTTMVLGEIFRAWGQKTFVGGNLGTPLVEAVEEGDWDWLVAEVSSFQLEAIATFRPRYALLLNLTEDHLDRYPDMAAYVAAKLRIFENMAATDTAVLNAEDDLVTAATRHLGCRTVHFSSHRRLAEGMGVEGDRMVWSWQGTEKSFPLAELRLRGLHNVENVMAAMIPALLEGCPAEIAWRAAAGYAGLPHRMVTVRVRGGVTWYDDSKGTNVGSVVKSLAGLSRPVTLIAGGKDKGGDYGPLAAPVADKVTDLILIGEAADRIEAALGGLTRTRRAATLEQAVALAAEVTPPGGAVLLSPGCSSFDMFRSYAERGEVFTRAVLALPERAD